jgi:hypothetical protein
MATVPAGAACYFCLGEEDDEEGMPLVRDCSCRGDSAGFAHFSCLTKYAEQKCKQAGDGDFDAFSEPWQICNNCKQPFQNQLAIDISSAFVSFAEATYGHPESCKWDKMKVMTAIKSNIMAFPTKLETDGERMETTVLINKLLSIIDQTKKDLKMSGWIHMPRDSEEYEYYKFLCGNYEAIAHMQIGINLDLTNEEDKTVAIGHLKKARAIYNLFDMKLDAKQIEDILSILAEKQATNDRDAVSLHFEFCRNQYERHLKTFGMNSDQTLRIGLQYIVALRDNYKCIEAERLAIKLATISRQVHGPEHKLTIETEESLKKCKVRNVWILPEKEQFQALRYENDGEICVVMGPIKEPRQVDNEREYRIANNLVLPKKGCAVICHGLMSASCLNGELGQLRYVKQDETGIRLGVNFEKKGVRSALVKPENLRIAFELPIERSELHF